MLFLALFLRSISQINFYVEIIQQDDNIGSEKNQFCLFY